MILVSPLKVTERGDQLIHKSSNSPRLYSLVLLQYRDSCPHQTKTSNFSTNTTWNIRVYSDDKLFLSFSLTICYIKKLSKCTANNCVNVYRYIHIQILTFILVLYAWVIFNYFVFHFSVVYVREEIDYLKCVFWVQWLFSFHSLTLQLCPFIKARIMP